MSQYSLSRQRDMDKKLQAADLVLVYQMGKVGSSSIDLSLEAAGIPSYHIHTFDDQEEFQIYRNHADVRCFFDWRKRFFYRLVLWHRKRLLQQRTRLKIITIVRDPVATVVSRFFQDLHIQFIAGKKNEAIHQDMESTYLHLVDAFENQLNLDYFTGWFDRELKRNFGIDILETPLDSGQAAHSFEHHGRQVLLLKCEAINQSEQQLADFLEFGSFTLSTGNEASNKWYSELYRMFKNRYDFTRLFGLYQAPLYQALYSPAEIDAFKSRWGKT